MSIGAGPGIAVYTGSRAVRPPETWIIPRAPTIYDTLNFVLLDLWLFEGTTNVYQLVSLEGTNQSKGQLANWVLITSGGVVTSVGAGNNISITGSVAMPIVNVSGTTNNSLQLGNASGSLTSLGVATNGQIPIGSTGTTPVLTTITAGSGITVTNAAGSITIAATGSGGGTVTGIKTQDGNTVTPTAGVIQLSGGNNIATTGTSGPNTATVSLTGITQHSLQVGGASNALTQLGVATNGQIPIGSTGANPVLATITAGANVTVTNAAGSITIAASGGGSSPATTCNFQVSNQAGGTNLFGGGNLVTVPFDTVQFDVGSNYSSNTFTAPATGYYFFYWTIFFDGISSGMTGGGFVQLLSSSGTSWWSGDINYYAMSIAPGASPNYVMISGSVTIPMSSGATAVLKNEIVGGSQSAGLAPFGGGAIGTYWGGYRIS